MAEQAPQIAAIIPVRNRSGVRLQNCLRSLRWQQVEAGAVEIVVSDFGSDGEHAKSIAEIAEEHGARVVRSDTRAYWNRSRALNIGIRASTADVVLCTDADMIFSPTFVPTILEEHAQAEQELLVVCRSRDLPEAVPEQLWEEQDFDRLLEQSTLHPAYGTGACQSAKRSFFEHVRGYDERYKYWGKEDMDMFTRAEVHGLAPRWIEDKSAMLHQWHEATPRKKGLLYRWNRLVYKFTRKTVIKNRRRWGEA